MTTQEMIARQGARSKPKNRPAYQERRAEYIANQMRMIQRRLGLRTQREMAAEMHMSENTYKRRLSDPATFRLDELWRLETVARNAGAPLEEGMVLRAAR